MLNIKDKNKKGEDNSKSWSVKSVDCTKVGNIHLKIYEVRFILSNQ